ncbi:cytochrome P450 [Micromonospora sp. CPCC 205546]|uniref:cytochrome P450 n=1 Tax=Micromonospora sp. CPCC 205546 TaxID=3122397 RepID=UPI002FEE730A
MTSTENEPVAYPFSVPVALDLDPRYAELRERPGLQRVKMTYGQPAWLAVRYEDVKVVLGDRRFSRAQAVGDDEPRVLPFVQRPDSIFTTDAPDHTRLRRAVGRAFTARRVEALRGAVESVVAEHLDALEKAGPPAELVHGFSLPVSMRVICDLLGVPFEQQKRFRGYADTILVNSPDVGIDPQQIVKAQLDLRAFLGELVDQRRAEPADDLLGVLVAGMREDGGLTEDEIIGLGVDVLVAGHETTANFLSNFVYLLLTTGTYTTLRDQPDLLPEAVEELLRITPLNPNAFMARVATEDVELGGQLVRAGEAVLPSMASGNRDVTVFENPEKIEFVERPPHLAFGHGAHHCLGAQLGRMELQIGISALITRFPDLALAVPAEDVQWRTTMLVRGPWGLPVTW